MDNKTLLKKLNECKESESEFKTTLLSKVSEMTVIENKSLTDAMLFIIDVAYKLTQSKGD